MPRHHGRMERRELRAKKLKHFGSEVKFVSAAAADAAKPYVKAGVRTALENPELIGQGAAAIGLGATAIGLGAAGNPLAIPLGIGALSAGVDVGQKTKAAYAKELKSQNEFSLEDIHKLNQAVGQLGYASVGPAKPSKKPAAKKRAPANKRAPKTGGVNINE